MTLYLLLLIVTAHVPPDDAKAGIQTLAGKYALKSTCEEALDILQKGAIKNYTYVCVPVKR